MDWNFQHSAKKEPAHLSLSDSIREGCADTFSMDLKLRLSHFAASQLPYIYLF